MTEYTGLFEHAAERYQAPDLAVEGVLRRRNRKQRNQRVSAMVVAAILTVAALGGLIRSFANVDGTRPATVFPTPTESVVQEDPLIIPPPPGVEPNMTIDQVEAYVHRYISRDEMELGKAIVPARIISIRFVEANERVHMGGMASTKEQFASWLVEYDGTVVECTSWCSVHPGATILVADGNPDGRGGSGVNRDPICFGPQRHPDAEPKNLHLPDCSQIPGSPVPPAGTDES